MRFFIARLIRAKRTLILSTIALIIISGSDSARANSHSWTMSQITFFTSNVGFGPYQPDLNNAGEIVYSYPLGGSAQIYSTVRGRLSDPSVFSFADTPRINNASEVVFRGGGPVGGNFGAFILNGSQVNLLPVVAVNNLAFNDLGEVVGLGIDSSNNSFLVSSTRGVLYSFVGGLNIDFGINNADQLAFTGISPGIPGLPSGAYNLTNNNQGDILFQTGTSIGFWDGTSFSTVFTGYADDPRMNDRGDVVFRGLDQNGVYQIYEATIVPLPSTAPVPEPCTALLLSTGVTALIVWGRLRC